MQFNRVKLEAMMAQAGYTTPALARAMGVHRTTVYLVLTGQREPGVEFLQGLSRVWPDVAWEDWYAD